MQAVYLRVMIGFSAMSLHLLRMAVYCNECGRIYSNLERVSDTASDLFAFFFFAAASHLQLFLFLWVASVSSSLKQQLTCVTELKQLLDQLMLIPQTRKSGTAVLMGALPGTGGGLWVLTYRVKDCSHLDLLFTDDFLCI